MVCLPGNSEIGEQAGDKDEDFPIPMDKSIVGINQHLSGARLLHTRLSSWLPSEKLLTLIRGGVDVAKVVHEELSVNLKRHIKLSERM